MKSIYVIISATPSKMGKCIRLFTHTPYNHVSISFDPELKDMVSFARYYREIPFYGGYTHESIERFHDSKILLYKIRLNDDDYNKVKEAIASFEENASDYLYHTINAFLCPFNKEIYIERAYTCLSFANRLLQETNLHIPTVYNIKSLMKLLEPYKVYEGTIHNTLLNSDPAYLKNFTMSEIIIKTYSQQKRLLSRLLEKDA